MPPRRRSNDKNLPPRVYQKHGAYYFVRPEGNKWIRLGKTEAEMYVALSRLQRDIDVQEKGMAALFARYEEEVIPQKAPRTQADNKKELANLGKAFGHMHPQSVRPVHVYQYLDARGAIAPVRANREVALLSHVFSYAIRWGAVEANPCRDIKKHSEKPRKRYVEDWEYRAVYAIAPAIVRAAMEIAVITGMRQGDILALKRSDLTEAGIPVTQAKTGKKQIFEWTADLRAAVDQALGIERSIVSMWVFATTTGRRYSGSGFQTAWQRLMNHAIEQQIIRERFTFHDLRAKAGSEAEDGTRLLGHQNPATTRRIYERKPDKVKPIR
ncbi:MAG: tyrosine-type recombinase/integrase [Hyphomicrobiaceae bacterium]